MSGGRAAALLGLLLLASCASGAEEAQVQPGLCRLPAEVRPVRLDPVPPDEVAADRPVDYHVLAISWSPDWCRSRGDDPDDRLQCRDNSFGWVLHGLWPSAEQGEHPRYCAAQTQLGAATLRRNLCMTPSAGLLQHEWAAHGTCGWREPDAYFAEGAQLWNKVQRPAPHGAATVGALRDRFVTANPGLPRAGVQVLAGQDGRLREVHLCYDLSSRPRACPAGKRGAPDRVRLIVEPQRPAR